MNRALVILLLFSFCDRLVAFLNQKYSPFRAGTVFIRNLMMQLEGGLTEQKEALILSEQERYTQAFLKLRKLMGWFRTVRLMKALGEQLKADWYGITFSILLFNG